MIITFVENIEEELKTKTINELLEELFGANSNVVYPPEPQAPFLCQSGF